MILWVVVVAVLTNGTTWMKGTAFDNVINVTNGTALVKEASYWVDAECSIRTSSGKVEYEECAVEISAVTRMPTSEVACGGISDDEEIIDCEPLDA